jgi:hypothetical protein
MDNAHKHNNCSTSMCTLKIILAIDQLRHIRISSKCIRDVFHIVSLLAKVLLLVNLRDIEEFEVLAEIAMK